MKIIVSHDVDHLTWSEHFFTDLYVPKLAARSLKLWLTGVIDAATFFRRINCWSSNRMNRIEEVIALEKSMNIAATYFFVMRKGLGVAYPAVNAKPVIQKLLKEGFSAGVHGMAYNDEKAMQEEFDTFKSISGLDRFGIRMHYLRNDESTRNKLAAAGYVFDSTDYEIANPYRVNNMIEFPISIMDVYSVRPEHKNMDIARQYTLDKLDEAEKKKLPFFTINFHDMLFDDGYVLYKEWFVWILELCKQRGYEFSSFENAMKEL